MGGSTSSVSQETRKISPLISSTASGSMIEGDPASKRGLATVSRIDRVPVGSVLGSSEHRMPPHPISTKSTKSIGRNYARTRLSIAQSFTTGRRFLLKLADWQGPIRILDDWRTNHSPVQRQSLGPRVRQHPGSLLAGKGGRTLSAMVIFVAICAVNQRWGARLSRISNPRKPPTNPSSTTRLSGLRERPRRRRFPTGREPVAPEKCASVLPSALTMNPELHFLHFRIITPSTVSYLSPPLPPPPIP